MRILNRSENQNDNQKIYELQKTLEHTYRKLHKSKQNDTFMKKCLWHRVTPKNCKIPDRLKKYQSKEETRKNERREIEKKIQINKNEVTILENKFENTLLTFRSSFKLTVNYETAVFNIKSKIHRSERNSDNKRERKFKNLLDNRFSSFSTVEVYNLTSTIIPEEVISILKLGKGLAIGGSPRGSNNFLAVEGLFNSFQAYGRENKMNEKILEEVRAHTILTGLDLEKCYTSDTRAHKLLHFLKQNPQLTLLNVDKSPSVCFIEKKSYHEKLNEVFGDDQNFEKILDFKLDIDLDSYRKLLRETISKNISYRTNQKLEPLNSISTGFGMMKYHKAHKAIRPIVTHYNSLVANAQVFIKNLIVPIAKNCKYAIDSPKKFKDRFLPDSLKFDPNLHEICLIDAQKLFTSINVNRTISHILKIIYLKPSNYFKEKDENNNFLPVPDRADLRKFMHGVLLNYNTFSTQIGTFKQRSGLSMGSPLSSSMSDIFLNLMETTLIDKFIKNDEIIHWSRYCDDILVICNKNSKNKILEKINGYDHRLNFTLETMQNDRIKFLDMEIFIENSQIKFRKLFKND